VSTPLPDSYGCGFAIPEAALPFDGPKTVTDVAGGAPRARQWRGDACGASAPLSGGMAGSEPGQPIGDVDAGGRHLVECAAIRSYAAAELTRARAREHVAVLLRTRSTGLLGGSDRSARKRVALPRESVPGDPGSGVPTNGFLGAEQEMPTVVEGE
jgi:hypothetical protein